jgi:hypothetical protein
MYPHRTPIIQAETHRHELQAVRDRERPVSKRQTADPPLYRLTLITRRWLRAGA